MSAEKKPSDAKFLPLPTKDDSIEDSDTEYENFDCGVGSFRPKWLQIFANPKSYLLFFCILGILQGAYFTYVIGIISTIEKRYAYDSKISGIILIADNISPIIISMVMGYYGGQANRPRLMAYGMLLVVVSCLLSTLPYFIYGPALHLMSSSSVKSNGTQYQMCGVGEEENCNSGVSSTTLPAVSLLFIANFINGFGNTAYYSLGMAYLDDNIKKKESPVYFSTSMGLRLFGPSLGFLLSSFCLKFYEDPTLDPGFTKEDPRWIGAWWMGFLIIGVLLFIFTLPMFFFPRKLAKIQASDRIVKPKLPNLKDMPKAVLQLLKNKIYLFHTAAHIFQIIGYAGYHIMMPRYMEAHFRKSASSASLFSGSTTIVTMLIGIILGGIVVRKCKPRPKVLTGYMVGVEMITVSTLFALMFFSCPSSNFAASEVNKELVLENSCNADCGCSSRVYQPSCSVDNTHLYFTPCHAGCTEVFKENITIFTNCTCSTEDESGSFVDLVRGYCPFDCNLFFPYILLLSLSKMVSSTSRVGSALITFRCVHPQIKTLALGTSSFVICAFALIPYPLIFGAIADATCLVWEKSCGKTGNCWVYDTDKLRVYLHGSAFLFLLIGTIFDFCVFLWSGSLPDFYEDELGDVSKPRVVGEWRKENADEDIVLFSKMKMAVELNGSSPKET